MTRPYKTKVLSEAHIQKMREATKRRWAEGAFDSPTIRESWRQNALSNIAKVGKVSTLRYEPSQEMIDDMSAMGDAALSSKWGVSKALIIKLRKRLGIKSFTAQHGLVPHKVEDGVEYKWCGSGHWENVDNFGRHSSRYDGLRGHCKEHSNESSRKSQTKIHATPEGKAKVRRNNSIRRVAFTLWERQDEIRAFELYDSRCGYCGTPVTSYTVEFDHILPVSKGGKTIPSNMIPSCVKCNRGVGGKKAKLLEGWIVEKFGYEIGNAILMQIYEKQSIIAEETRERLEQAINFPIGEN
jgi:5-methylcytosine-specific restriction endonuclease McrA